MKKGVESRDLHGEESKCSSNLKIELPRFTGYDSFVDIYTFRDQFEKFVHPTVRKPLLADVIKQNYLGKPAITLVKELDKIDDIWARLFEAYGDHRVPLQNKEKRSRLFQFLDKERRIVWILDFVIKFRVFPTFEI